MAAICKTVAPAGMGGALTDFMFQRVESTREPGFPAADDELRPAASDFEGSGTITFGFSGSAE